jgi:hypothetical protein
VAALRSAKGGSVPVNYEELPKSHMSYEAFQYEITCEE